MNRMLPLILVSTATSFLPFLPLLPSVEMVKMAENLLVEAKLLSESCSLAK